MKKLLLAVLLALVSLGAADESVRLEISFAVPPQPEGSVQAALFSDEESFDEWKDPVRSVALPLGEETLLWIPEPLPAGTYALLAFQDLNEDGVLNFDERGRPTEPFTASGRMGRGGPRFRRAAMELAAGEHRVEISDWRFRAPRETEP